VLPAVTPTIAETGIPVSAGPGGPGPASGTLYDIKAGSSASAATPADPAPTPAASAADATPKHETAEEEKKRLAALYSPPVQSTPAPATSTAPASSSTDQPQRYESADDEKKRLEREERERILRGNSPPPDVPAKDEEELPPYQEPGL